MKTICTCELKDSLCKIHHEDLTGRFDKILQVLKDKNDAILNDAYTKIEEPETLEDAVKEVLDAEAHNSKHSS